MPTILTHSVVPLALGSGLGRAAISRRLLIFGVAGSMLPDLDVLAFHFGIPYAAEFGHRGFSHSLLFAFLIALLGACLFRWLQSTFIRSFAFIFFAVSSHGILDAFTNGGLGIAFLWPWSGTRFFAPLHPIEVSPIGLGFFAGRGLHVLESEIVWVWLPCAIIYLFMAISNKLSQKFRAASAHGD
jgi:inner membrane protein